MKYAANGSVLITTTKDAPGLFSQDGYTQVTDVTSTPNVICGLYAPDGSLNVTILTNELLRVPALAPNGSVYVVDGAGPGIYSPCGAMNISFSSAPLVPSLTLTDSLVSASDATGYTFASRVLGAGQIIIAGTARAGVVFTLSSVVVDGITATVAVQRNRANTLSFIAYAPGITNPFGNIDLNFSATVARVGLSVYRAQNLTQQAPYLTGSGERGNTAGTLTCSLIGAIQSGFAIGAGFNGQPPGHRHSSASVATVPQTDLVVTFNSQASNSAWAGLTEDVDLQSESAGTAADATGVSAAFR